MFWQSEFHPTAGKSLSGTVVIALENLGRVLILVGPLEAGSTHIQSSIHQRGALATSVSVAGGFLVEGASLCFCTALTPPHSHKGRATSEVL